MIAATFSSLGSIPVCVTSCSKNVNLGNLNSHLSCSVSDLFPSIDLAQPRASHRAATPLAREL